MFEYVIEKKLPSGSWQKITGTMTLRTIDEVKKALAQQYSNSPIKIISIKEK